MSKVTFDGPNKRIIINSGVTDIDVQQDIYLPWKQWVIDSGSMYLPAFRTFGGDPTTLNQNAPTYYFLINNWLVKAVDVYVTVHENLYSDDSVNPFVITNSAVLSRNSDIPGISEINNSLTGITSDLKLVLGLTQHNYRLSDHVYDSGQRLTSVKIKLYDSKADCDSSINNFAEYQMSASYDSAGLLIDYKVVKT